MKTDEAVVGHSEMKTKLSAVIIAGMALAGCATEGARKEEQPQVAREPTGRQGCFYIRQVNDFRALDRSNLIVYAPTRSTAYHVRISPPSTELKFANALAFQSRSNRICGYAGDRIVFRGTGAGNQVSVTNVYRLDEVGLQRLLAAYGLAEGAEVLEPEEGEAAEIERDIEPESDEE